MSKDRVVLAMSGGVDSSASAALLKREGLEVVGVTMVLAPEPERSRRGGTSASNDVEDARAVAKKLGIEHLTLNFQEIFEKEIIVPYANAYAQGLTPNPCAVCNRKIKFGVLAAKARELGAKWLATGHYARVATRSGRKMIAQGKDAQKDQSYFLFTLKNDDLEFIRFPVGEFTKKEVRDMAAELDLPVARKSESKEACFVTGYDYLPVVERYADEIPAPGEITLSDGRVVGRHKGVHRFTVGQREGLNVSLGRPMYIIGIDAEHDRIIIGGREECRSEELVARAVIWNYYESAKENMEVSVRIRYRTKPLKARLFPMSDSRMKVVFTEEAPLVTPGQAAVFYRDELVLGGGWIERPIR